MVKQVLFIGVVILCFWVQAALGGQEVVITIPEQSSYAETLAAKELRRYLYLRTDKMLTILKSDVKIPAGSFIAVAEKGRNIVRQLAGGDEKVKAAAVDLQNQQYLIKTVGAGENKGVVIIGGDSAGVLYGTYKFLEMFGVRFYLDGDIVPDKKIKLKLPQVDETGRPLFAIRGIFPFHDFPEGPDWWDLDGFKGVIGQLPKLGMNFIGLHTYPEKNPDCQFGNSEPTVWIGLPEDIGPDGTVKFSYRARYFTTMSKAWGYRAKKTSEFSLGASEFFERDDYGVDYMAGMSPWPETPERCDELFKRAGDVLKDAFTFAHRIGVKTCVGTELALSEPNVLKQKLRDTGKEPFAPATVQEIYEGIFTRIMKTYPLDYYFLWTPEGWTWLGTQDKEVEAVLQDLKIAISAAEKVKATFTLATCGWVLGPQQDRAMFDRVMPKGMPLTCISRDVGFAFVEPGFAGVKGRAKWSIPWLEDDPALTIPQLWAGRMRRDAADSLNYGCDGLIGLHWRTRIIGPTISALARAGWKQDFAKGLVSDPQRIASDPNNTARDLEISDFYSDWAVSQFGVEAADAAAKIFTRLDGGPFSNVIHKRKTNLPRPATWIDGPGGIKADERLWEQVAKEYGFVDEFAKLRKKVKGTGNFERFDYWLNNFRYLRAVGELGCLYGQFNRAVAEISDVNTPQERKTVAKEKAVSLRRQMGGKIAEAHKYLLQTVSTTGGLGTVTNWQTRIIPKLLDDTRKKLFEVAGEELAEDVIFPQGYDGPARVFVPTVRGSIEAGEELRLKVIILDSGQPKKATVYWSRLGEKKYNEAELKHIGRGVYGVRLAGSEMMQGDIEYYIKVSAADGKDVYFPATAPAINQTVIVVEEKT